MTYSIFPNPASNSINIFIDPSSHNNVKMVISNAEGKILYRQENLQPAVSYTVDLSHFASGAYFIMLSDGSGIVPKRFTVYR